MNKIVLGLTAVLGFVAFAGCSDDDTPAGTDDAEVVNVEVSNNVFTPAQLTIKVGQTVRWTWVGGVHNVVSGANCADDDNFKSGVAVSGGTYDKKFETAGTFPYFCEPHCQMGMVGEVVVEE